jgi:cell division inhibitor SulA
VSALAKDLSEVLARPDIWRGDRLVDAPIPGVPSGFASLDAHLSGGGWPRGALIEVLLDGVGLGELSLLLPTLARIKEEGGWTLLVAPPHEPHAPAWAAAGVDLARLAVVSPVRPADTLWAMEQALLSGAPEAVLSWAEQIDPRQLRRLQVAAADGSALAFLFRPARAAQESSVAPLRLRLSSGHEGALTIHILKRRGPPLHAPLHLILPRPARWRSHESSAPLAGVGVSASAAGSPRRSVVA